MKCKDKNEASQSLIIYGIEERFSISRVLVYSFFLSALRDCKKSISQVDQSLIILNDETLFSKPCRSGNCVHCLQRFRSDSGISKFGWCKQLL